MDFDDDRHRNRYNISGRIMITAGVCIFLVVVVVVGLQFYARRVLRRQARRGEAIRQLQIGVRGAQAQNMDQRNRGCDAAVILSLPIFAYKATEHMKNNDSHTECTVCLSNIEEGEMARLLPNCKHIFHSECIDAWLGAHSTCPICRTEAEPRVQPESVELAAVVAATAPPVDSMNSKLPCSERTSDGPGQSSKAIAGSSSRLSSFRRMLSREKSDRKIQPSHQTDCVSDLERQ